MYGKAIWGGSAAAGGGTLALTGADVTYWVIAGVTLVLLGISLTRLARRTGRKLAS